MLKSDPCGERRWPHKQHFKRYIPVSHWPEDWHRRRPNAHRLWETHDPFCKPTVMDVLKEFADQEGMCEMSVDLQNV
jgi:hypothetical protein